MNKQNKYFTNNNVASFKYLSYDDNSRESLVDIDDLFAYNFDSISKQFCNDNNYTMEVSSIDAFYINKDKTLFIEFKNGGNTFKIRYNKKNVETIGEFYKICKKIYDSLLIYISIIGEDVIYTKKNIDFILLYNYEKVVEKFGIDNKGIINRCIVMNKNEYEEKFGDYFKNIKLLDRNEFLKNLNDIF